MENIHLSNAINYIEFLRTCGYYVSLSGFEDRFEPYTKDLLSYEIHLHSICNYLKQCKGTQGMCVANKRRLTNAHVNRVIYSCCYAGVEEYVIPVIYEDVPIINVNVSGYRDTLEKSKERKNQIAKLCDQDFKRLYKELSTTPPTKENVLSFVKPLEYMLVELYKHCKENKSNKSKSTKVIYLKAMEYIHENYMHKLSCESIAKELNYSTSYLRYIFKCEGVTSINKQINNIRLERAKYLLESTSQSITEIAYSCGFCDSNYFSTTFKAKYGKSPKKIRS